MQGPTLALDDDHIPIAAVQMNGAVQPDASQPLATTLPADAHDDLVPGQDHGDPEPKSEFWNNNDFGATGMNAPTGSFVRDVYITEHKKQPHSTMILGALACVIACGLIWNRMTDGPSPMDAVVGFWHSLVGDDVNANVNMNTVAVHKAKKSETDLADTAEDNDESANHPLVTPDQTFENPYLRLKNEIHAKTLKKSEKLHAAQENDWRAGLESPYYYQRYKTVLDVVAAHKFGSESILRDALQSGKFWMRMRAVMGLADMGYIVTPEDIKTALGDGHNELRTRFFMRFEKGDCSPGCLFVARGSLVNLSPDGRLQALRVLQRDRSPATASYMVAATFDRDTRVRQLAREWLLQNPVEESEWWTIYNLINQTSETSVDTKSTSTQTDPGIQG